MVLDRPRRGCPGSVQVPLFFFQPNGGDDGLFGCPDARGATAGSEQVGAKTLEELDVQGDKLRRVEQGMDHINSDMKVAEKSIHNMEKCCG